MGQSGSKWMTECWPFRRRKKQFAPSHPLTSDEAQRSPTRISASSRNEATRLADREHKEKPHSDADRIETDRRNIRTDRPVDPSVPDGSNRSLEFTESVPSKEDDFCERTDVYPMSLRSLDVNRNAQRDPQSRYVSSNEAARGGSNAAIKTSTSTSWNEASRSTSTLSRASVGRNTRHSLPKGAKCHPIGIYDHLGPETKRIRQTIDFKLIRKWIRDQRQLAPFFEGSPGDPDSIHAHKTRDTVTATRYASLPGRRRTIECPICLLYYPRDCINRSRCCRQPICTECFVYMSAARALLSKSPSPSDSMEAPSTTTTTTTNTTFERSSDRMIYLNGRRYRRRRLTVEEQQSFDRQITCPFCTATSYGVVYVPDYRSDDDEDDPDAARSNADCDETSSLAHWKWIEERAVVSSLKHYALEEVRVPRTLSRHREQAYYAAVARQGRLQTAATSRRTHSADVLLFQDQIEAFRRLLQHHPPGQDMSPELLERLRALVDQQRPAAGESTPPHAEQLWNFAEELLLLHTMRLSVDEQTPNRAISSPSSRMPSSTSVSDTASDAASDAASDMGRSSSKSSEPLSHG